jgi:hypothetical protein
MKWMLNLQLDHTRVKIEEKLKIYSRSGALAVGKLRLNSNDKHENLASYILWRLITHVTKYSYDERDRKMLKILTRATKKSKTFTDN